MPRKSAVADVGRPVSLVEILDDPEKYLFTQVMMATEEVVQYAHPDNPQMHDDDDIPEHARSLLMAGWQEVGVTLSITTRYLTGGHGRSAGALMNLGQPQEYFDDQWQLWLKDPDRKEISDRAKARFCPDFWRTCPVWITEISPTDQLAMMVRLNNEDASGSPDRRKMAALLSRLPKQQVELAGWEPGQAKAFASAYLVRAPQFEPEPAKPDLSGYDFDPGLPPEEGVEYQDKERFEYPDATDYSGGDDGEAWDDEHGPVQVMTASGQVVEMADVDVSEVQNVETDVFKHSSHYSETRAILYISKEELLEWKERVAILARVFGTNQNGEIAKVWRSQTTLNALRWMEQNHPRYAEAQAAIEADRLAAANPEPEPEDDDED